MWLKNPPRTVPEHALAALAVGALPFANGVNATAANKVAIIRVVGRGTYPPSGCVVRVGSVMDEYPLAGTWTEGRRRAPLPAATPTRVCGCSERRATHAGMP